MFEAWLKWETGTGYEERSWCTVIVALVNCGHSDASKAIISQIMDSHSHPLKLILGKLLIHKVGVSLKNTEVYASFIDSPFIHVYFYCCSRSKALKNGCSKSPIAC